jgi:hypothetical protein
MERESTMTKPRVHMPGEDDITDLSIPVPTVPYKSIVEEPPIDDEDTVQSLPINVVPKQPTIAELPIRDEDTVGSRSKSRAKPSRNLKKSK